MLEDLKKTLTELLEHEKEIRDSLGLTSIRGEN